jgi:outer membrane receptor for ferrienterochelin and colicins
VEIQPGIRYAYNTAFNSPLVYSLNLKYDITRTIIWRASIAKGFRAPSLKELYYNFMNSSHDVHGNPDLKAEYSHNVNMSLSYQPTDYLSVKLFGFYTKLKNKIEMVENASIRSNYYDYENVNKYESTGGNLAVEIKPDMNFRVNLGGGFTGRYNDYAAVNNSRRFNYSPDLFAGIFYSEPYTKIQGTLDYKYNGKRPFLYADNTGAIQEGSQNAYHFMNLSANRNFLQNHLKLEVGVRNLFDVTSVKSIGANTSAHSNSTSTAITYGRSFFLQLGYSL